MQYISSVNPSAYCFMQRLLGAFEPLGQPQFDGITTSTPTTSLQDIPIEILLHIFSFLKLKSYIIAHGVCKDWRQLLPLSDIHPARRRLFTLYNKMIKTTQFSNSRPWTLQNLHPFDRQAYIDALLAQYPVVPEEFRIWILEWPARLAIGCMWPGLPFTDCSRGNAMRRYGVNWFGYNGDSPQLLAVICKHNAPVTKYIPCLLMWRAFTTTEWLVFDHDNPNLFGRVYVTDLMRHESSVVIPHDNQLGRKEEGGTEFDSLYEHEEEDYCHEQSVFPDWISYLEYQWDMNVRDLPLVGKPHAYSDRPISRPIKILFDQSTSDALPAFPWISRLDHMEHLYSN